jgi:lipopolysaccharide transport system permease protein
MPQPPNSTDYAWTHSVNSPWLGQSVKELWQYRHLLGRLVRRDFLLNYQQTILGPLWVIFQPLATLATYIIVFSRLINISTGGVSPVFFYLAGIILWGLFSEAFVGNAFILRDNAHIFNKVYFPRLITPLATTSTHLLRFAIQFGLFLILLTIASVFDIITIDFGLDILLIIPLVLLVAMYGLSSGLLFTMLTGKYRDLSNLVHLGIRLFMFLSPVIYPLSAVPVQYRKYILWNPLTACFEAFRLILLGEGLVTPSSMLYSVVFGLALLAGSVLWYNRRGEKLLDVV